jgi:MinD-like ATPase involved in chromosome partitioning or flagellar assembly
VTVEVARQLDVPDMMLIVNKLPLVYDAAEVRDRVEKTYDCDVAAVLPHSDSMMALGSSDIFVLRYPNHSITKRLLKVTNRLIA